MEVRAGLNNTANGTEPFSPSLAEIRHLHLGGNRVFLGGNQRKSRKTGSHIGYCCRNTAVNQANLLLVANVKLHHGFYISRFDYRKSAANVFHELLAFQMSENSFSEVGVLCLILHEAKISPIFEVGVGTMGAGMTQQWWAALRHRVDERAVQAMEEIFGEGGNRERVRYLRDLDALDEPTFAAALSELPKDVQDLVTDLDLPPFLASMEGLEEAQRAACHHFQEDALAFIIALLCKSLPECYAGARGAKVLARTGALGDPRRDRKGLDDTMVRRVMETAVFVQNVMDWNMWTAPNRPAIRTIQKVRLFHAGVRVMIHRHGQRDGQPWDYNNDGAPINMQDTVATLLAFSMQSVRGARRLGYRISKQQERNFLLHWIVIGHHLGLAEDVLLEAWNKPEAMWESVCNDEFRYSEDGDVLTTALRIFLREHVFFIESKKHVPLMFMKRLMDPRALTALKLDKVRAANDVLYRFLFALIFIVHNILMLIPFVGKAITRWMGREMIEFTTKEWAGDNPAEITLERELQSV